MQQISLMRYPSHYIDLFSTFVTYEGSWSLILENSSPFENNMHVFYLSKEIFHPAVRLLLRCLMYYTSGDPSGNIYFV